MKRSRLKNIINKSKDISNPIGAFDKFKKSLPIEIDNDYRLEAAWKAYGLPKDYKAALWEGLVQPIDETTFKLPSIGYNEETEEYEYLNKGRDNELVNKDLRVWDNDVIPFVLELKQGGYIKSFDEEKDCWIYTKNSQKSELPIEEFKAGGKKKIKIKTHEDTYIELDSLTEDLKNGRTPVGKNSKGLDLYLGGDGIAAPLNHMPHPKTLAFKQGGKSEYKKVKSDKAYYDKDSDTVYYTNDEDLIHEGFHARPDYVLLEQLKPYYENLNDEKILNFGGNLLFVKRFEGDPGHFYSPEELGARISAAKFRTEGNNYTPEFFKYLRTNENLYGDNMRDLLYMYNDENLSKIFNLGNTQQFKQGGKPSKRSETVIIADVNHSGAPFINRLLREDTRSIQVPGEKLPSTHLLTWSTDNKGNGIVYPMVMEDENGNLKYYENDAYKRALETNNYVVLTPEEAKWFTENYKTYYPKFFKHFQDGGVIYYKQGGQLNVIPDGALHAHKNHMDLAEKGQITPKGVPVIDKEGVLQAEVEREEWTMTKELTDDVEAWYKEYYKEDTSLKRKDELAIKCGKRITEELLHNTDDRTNLISKLSEEEE